MNDDDQVRISTSLVRRANNMGLPFGALSAIAELKGQLKAVESLAIEEARKKGATWDVIATALGITRQALHQRLHAAGRRGKASSSRTDAQAGSRR